MTPTEIETTLDQLVRRAKAVESVMEQGENATGSERWTKAKAAHGVAPFEEPRAEGLKYGAEIVQLGPQAYPFEPRTKMHYLDMDGVWNARGFMEDTGQFKTYSAALSALNAAPPPPGFEPQPAPPPEPAERVRWFRWELARTVREFPSGNILDMEGNFRGKTSETMERCISCGDTELDGPPPHGKPLAAPKPEAGEATGADSDGIPDAPSDRTRLTLYPSKMCEATRAAFDWIKSHDGGAHGALFTRALSDAAAEYAAHMTASLRAEVEAQKQRINEWHVQWSKVRDERDELRAEVERLMTTRVPKPTPRTRTRKAKRKVKPSTRR